MSDSPTHDDLSEATPRQGPAAGGGSGLEGGVGTLAWARRTGGRLSSADQLRLVGQGVLFQLGRMPSVVRRWLGLPKKSTPFAGDPFTPPDTAIARVAERAVAAVSPPPLVHHVYRTYAWGRILAAQARRPLDVELFYAACLLHDLGLAMAAADRPPGSSCFAYDGAEAARQVVIQEGLDAARADAVADAICLHLNVRVSLRHGPEAHFLNAAAALDVAGLGRGRIAPEDRARVNAAHPRDGWAEEILPLLGTQARERPGSRIHFLIRRFAFDRRAARVR